MASGAHCRRPTGRRWDRAQERSDAGAGPRDGSRGAGTAPKVLSSHSIPVPSCGPASSGFLGSLNRRTEAVRRFDQFARRLDRELGMEPEPDTRRLVERLKRKE